MTPQPATLRPAIPQAPWAAIASGRILFIAPAARYPSTPPHLFNFACADPATEARFRAVIARPDVACPPEPVVLFPDAVVLDGRHVVTREGSGVAESFTDVLLDAAQVARQQSQLAAIAAGDFSTLPAAGPPVVAIFKEGSGNFGHLIAEMLPKLLHVAALGLREVRLLLPQDAEPVRDIVAFTARLLGIAVAFVPCPAGSILRVPALHWAGPVSRHNARKSPTLLQLFARLRAAVAADGPRRLYITRPAGTGRAIRNAAVVTPIIEAAGYTAVEPSRLDFPAQLALFAGARQVLGTMGAGLTLAGLMPPGARLTMLDPTTCDFFFWDLACLAGLRFDWAFTCPVEALPEERLGHDFTLDPALLRDLLAWLET